MNGILRAAVLVSLGWVGGCRSTWYSYAFTPAPLEVALDTPHAADARGRALVTVVGIRRADEKAGTPARVEVRMRLENLGERELTVVADSFRMVSASLENFAGPTFAELPAAPLGRNETAVFDVHFGLPDGKEPDSLGLAGLNLRWEVDFDGERVGTGVTFERRTNPYPYPWYHDPFYDPWCFHTRISVVGHAHED